MNAEINVVVHEGIVAAHIQSHLLPSFASHGER